MSDALRKSRRVSTPASGKTAAPTTGDSMKNILMIAGAIFILLIVTLAVLVGIVATKGEALDRESKQYADTAMRAILSSWDERQLLDRANSELLKSIARQGGTRCIVRAVEAPR